MAKQVGRRVIPDRILAYVTERLRLVRKCQPWEPGQYDAATLPEDLQEEFFGEIEGTIRAARDRMEASIAAGMVGLSELEMSLLVNDITERYNTGVEAFCQAAMEKALLRYVIQ